jgi:hypothetical protein
MKAFQPSIVFFVLFAVLASISEARAQARIEIDGRQVLIDPDAVTFKANKNMPIENLMRAVEKEEALLRVVKVSENVYVVSMLDGLPRGRQRLQRSSLLEIQPIEDSNSAGPRAQGPRDREILQFFNQ